MIHRKEALAWRWPGKATDHQSHQRRQALRQIHLMTQYAQALASSGVNKEQILHINFENMRLCPFGGRKP